MACSLLTSFECGSASSSPVYLSTLVANVSGEHGSRYRAKEPDVLVQPDCDSSEAHRACGDAESSGIACCAVALGVVGAKAAAHCSVVWVTGRDGV